MATNAALMEKKMSINLIFRFCCQAMLTGGMVETGKDEIEIHEVSSKIFCAVLNFIYTGKTDMVKPYDRLIENRVSILFHPEYRFQQDRHGETLQSSRRKKKAFNTEPPRFLISNR